jgi:hypothetical protein
MLVLSLHSAQGSPEQSFPASSPCSTLSVGSYTIAVISGRDTLQAATTADSGFPIKMAWDNIRPHSLLIRRGDHLRVETLGGTGESMMAAFQALTGMMDGIFPTWRKLPVFLARTVSRHARERENEEDASAGEVGLGLIIIFLFANWLLLVFGGLVFGGRIWNGGECLRAAPVRSLFWASLTATGLFFAGLFLAASLIGLPLAGILSLVCWVLLLLSAGVVAAGITGIFWEPDSILGRVILLGGASPLVFLPMLLHETGLLLTLLLLLAGFGGLILAGFAPVSVVPVQHGKAGTPIPVSFPGIQSPQGG